MISPSPRPLRKPFSIRERAQRQCSQRMVCANGLALGLSRAEMDLKRLERAKNAGVRVLEGTHASDLIQDRGCVRGLRLKCGSEIETTTRSYVDATGRHAPFRENEESSETERSSRYRLVLSRPIWRTHKWRTERVRLLLSGGYGGLSSVEGGASNFCFIAAAKDVRRCGSDLKP